MAGVHLIVEALDLQMVGKRIEGKKSPDESQYHADKGQSFGSSRLYSRMFIGVGKPMNMESLYALLLMNYFLHYFFKQLIQVFIALFFIGLYVPQTGRLNLLLRKMFETGYFRNWREAKTFLRRLSWGGIVVFYAAHFFLGWFW